MYSPHKHSYLQSRSSRVNPRVINRSVNLARQKPTIDTADIEPPLQRLVSEQPNIPIDNVDVTRQSTAFGRWAIPKLCKELNSADRLTVIRTTNSIMDLAHYPENVYEAIKLKVPQRMIHLLRSNGKEIRERVCMALTVSSGHTDGADMLLKNATFLKNLAMVIEDPSPAVRIKAAILLEMLSKNWMGVYELVKTGFVPLLLKHLIDEEEEIVSIHLKSLQRLLQAEGKVSALENGAFGIMVKLLDKTNNAHILSGVADCIAYLAIIDSGKKIAYSNNVLSKLNKLLHDERPEVYSSATAAIMYTTLLTEEKFRAQKLPNLPERLLELSKGAEDSQTRIYSVKALTNVCEHPAIRKKIVEKHIKDVENIPVNNIPELEQYKKILLDVLFWTPDKL